LGATLVVAPHLTSKIEFSGIEFFEDILFEDILFEDKRRGNHKGCPDNRF